MIKSDRFPGHIYHPLIKRLLTLSLLLLIAIPCKAAKPPKELSKVIDHFMHLESTSISIDQVIEWKFSNKRDTVHIQMDIKAGRQFHVRLSDFGMEMFVADDQMITLNHFRQQFLVENASPDALLKQLFVGGDLNQARFKGEKKSKDGNRRLHFKFDGDFSDWERLDVVLSGSDDLEKVILVDYDGNSYMITLRYSHTFENFVIPDINKDYPSYQKADLRGK